MPQVYLDRVYDLLAPGAAASGERRTVEVRAGAKGGCAMPDLQEVRVNSAQQAWDLLRGGLAARASAETDANAQSSRSHCMLCVRVAGTSRLTGAGHLNWGSCGMVHFDAFVLSMATSC